MLVSPKILWWNMSLRYISILSKINLKRRSNPIVLTIRHLWMTIMNIHVFDKKYNDWNKEISLRTKELKKWKRVNIEVLIKGTCFSMDFVEFAFFFNFRSVVISIQLADFIDISCKIKPATVGFIEVHRRSSYKWCQYVRVSLKSQNFHYINLQNLAQTLNSWTFIILRSFCLSVITLWENHIKKILNLIKKTFPEKIKITQFFVSVQTSPSSNKDKFFTISVENNHIPSKNRHTFVKNEDNWNMILQKNIKTRQFESNLNNNKNWCTHQNILSH